MRKARASPFLVASSIHASFPPFGSRKSLALTDRMVGVPADSGGQRPAAHDAGSLQFAIRSLLAGAVAGGVAKTIVAPLDRVKILFQGQNTSYEHHRGSLSGAFSVVKHIWETEGLRGLFKVRSLDTVFCWRALAAHAVSASAGSLGHAGTHLAILGSQLYVL